MLTEAGRSYVTASRRILEEIKEAEGGASGEYRTPQGDLRITAPIVFGRLHVLPVSIAFLNAYRDINIRLVLADQLFNLLEDRVEVAVRIGALPDSSLKAHRIGSIRQVVCASPSYFATRGFPKTPLDLRHHDCVVFDGLSSLNGWTFTAGNSKKAIAIRSRLGVNTAEAAIDAAIAGVGLTSRAFVPSCKCSSNRRVRDRSCDVRAGGVAHQSGLPRRKVRAGETAGISRFHGAATQGAAASDRVTKAARYGIHTGLDTARDVRDLLLHHLLHHNVPRLAMK